MFEDRPGDLRLTESCTLHVLIDWTWGDLVAPAENCKRTKEL